MSIGGNDGALGRLNEEQRAEYWASLALRRTKGIGIRTVCRLLKYFGSAYAAVYAVPRWREAGVAPGKGTALSGEEWRREARPEWEDARDLDGEILLWTDPRYPSLLRELPDAPPLLYARGDLSLLLRPCMAIVGSRGCSRQGREQSAAVARELSACGIAVVSGMARGIDRAAHEAALEEQGSSIAVLGSGVDVIYPRHCTDIYRELITCGLILSEFHPGTLPQGPNFPIRNRIISGLSLGVIVGEAALKSGSMVTARIALEQNRSVYTLQPARSVSSQVSEGCGNLIEQGAKSVTHPLEIIKDILPQLQEMPPVLIHTPSHSNRRTTRRELPLYPKEAARPIPSPEHKAPSPLSPEAPSPEILPSSPAEAAILEQLRMHGSLDVDSLLEFLPSSEESDAPPLSVDVGSLNALLLMMEVRGMVRRLPGNMYEAVHHVP